MIAARPLLQPDPAAPATGRAATFACALALVVLAAATADPTRDLPAAGGLDQRSWLFWGGEGLLCLLVLLGPGRGLLRETTRALAHGSTSLHTPVVLGAAMLWLYSTRFGLARPATPSFYDAAAGVVALVLLARWLEQRAMERLTDGLPLATVAEGGRDHHERPLLVPAIMLLSLLTFAARLAFGGEQGLAHAVSASAAVLFAASPGLFDLAARTALAAGLRPLIAAGVRLRDAGVIEGLARLDVLVLIKTGTLTAGRPRLIEIVPARGWDVSDILRQATAVEQHSTHPLARAIVADVTERGIAIPPASSFQAQAGLGARATVAGRVVRVGSRAYLEASGLDTSPFAGAAGHLTVEGQTPVLVAVGEEVAGLLGVADAARAEARDTVAKLRHLGLEVILLTGDDQEASDALARQVGITRVLAEVPPGERVARLREMQQAGRHVGLVGEGGSDAASLAQADVGFAAADDHGPDVAGARLAGESLAAVPLAIRAARAARSSRGRRRAWALAYHVVAVAVASGALLPLLGPGLAVSPLIAGVAMSMSALPLLAGALRPRPAVRTD